MFAKGRLTAGGSATVVFAFSLLLLVLVELTCAAQAVGEVSEDRPSLLLNGISPGQELTGVVNALRSRRLLIQEQNRVLVVRDPRERSYLLLIAFQDGLVQGAYTTSPSLTIDGEHCACDFEAACFKSRILPFQSAVTTRNQWQKVYFDQLQLMLLKQGSTVEAAMIGPRHLEHVFRTVWN